jgi:hypothetical protein
MCAAWLSWPTSFFRTFLVQAALATMHLIDSVQAWCLLSGRDIKIRLVSSIHPRTIRHSAGNPSARSFGMKRIARRMMGSRSSPAWGRLVTYIVRGTVCGWRARLYAESRNTLMRSSMKPSTRLVAVVGIWTAMGRALATGTLGRSQIGVGLTNWSGLRSFAGSQSLHWLISLARSVTILEKLHQVGGLGEPQR